jgi:hypothetical protein
MLVEGCAHHARHVRQVSEQVQEAVHVAPKLDRAVLRQRPHDRRPEQPEFGREKLLGKELIDTPPAQHCFGRQHDPREAQPVAQAEAEPPTVHDAAVAIEDVSLVLVRLARIEGEEILRDGNRGIACRGNRLEQVERAAEFLVKDGAREVVAIPRAAAEIEPAAQLLVRLIDCDIRPRHPRVADEQRGRRQSAKSTTDDMRCHGLLLGPRGGKAARRGADAPIRSLGTPASA